jgi:uncharacterized protein YjgD (DUF1641 family)
MSLSMVGELPGGVPSPEPHIPAELLERLSDPKVVEGLTALLDRVDVLAFAVTALDGFLAHSETILNSVIDSAQDAKLTVEGSRDASGLDLRASADAGAQLLSALPRMAPALLRGVDSGAIDELTSPALVRTLHMVSEASRDGFETTSPVTITGPVSVLRALRDPDVARGLSFFVTVARSIGRQLAPGHDRNPS